MKKPLLFLLLFVTSLAHATHIVGGFISYRWISGATYEIKLTIYRDCNSTTPFDGTGGTIPAAYLGLFETSTGNLQNTFSLVNPVITPITAPTNNPCLQINTSVCVEQGVYTMQITLPSANVGYTLVHERCCRNGTISNVFDPSNQGAVYSAYIPPSATYQNTSPVFNNLPPLFICVNSPLVFNYSATDADGDVLRYSLCTPSTGGSPNDPAPNPPLSPPFNDITWQSPYNLANLLGGAPPLAIDSVTGVLTGTPNSIGQFVVGVCISEYRNGQLLGTYLQDYQLNVTQCNIPAASIPSTNINPQTGIGLYIQQCSSYTVTFQNNTYNPPPTNVPLVYHWDFGVNSLTNDTSNVQYPVYTYPDTGTYLVQLIAVKGTNSSPCTDTTYAFVRIYPTFTTNFTTADVCQNITASFTDNTVSNYGTINQWNWSFGDGATSNTENPQHTYISAGTYNVTLIDQNTLGCKDTAQGTITIHAAPNPSFITGPTCVNSPVQFNNTSTGSIATTLWNFGTGVDTSGQQNPSFTYASTGSYNVSLILSSTDGCWDTATQTITIHPLPTVVTSPDTTICPFTSAQLSASGGVSYVWSPATGLSDPNIANPVATPTPPGASTYSVQVTDQFQCVNSGSVTISFHPIPQIDAGLDTSVCLNPGSFRDSVQLHATGGVSYVWSPATGLSSTTSANPISRPPNNITYFVLGTDLNGCKLTDSVTVLVLDPSLNLILETSAQICERDTAYVTIANQGVSSYRWSPNQYLTDPSSFNTGFNPPDTTTYILTVSNYCYTKSDSVTIDVWPIPHMGLNPVDSICNGQTKQLNAYNASIYQWDADPTLSSTTISNPIASPTVTTEYYVTGTNQYGCTNRDSTLLIVYFPSVIHVLPDDTPFICQGTSATLRVTGAYTYVWSPASSLSSATSASPVATPMDTTTYTVVATNVHGCISTDSLTIPVQMPVTAVTETPFNACQGIPLQLHASGGFYYEWLPHTGLSNPFVSNPFATPDSTTNYVIRVSNDCFSDTAVTVVVIHQLPQVDAGPDTLIYRDTQAQLHGTTPEANHFWNPSTWLDDPMNLDTKAEPQQTTWYELFAIDAYGCMNKDSVLVTVEPYTIMDIPTAFSPNGDGVNEVFHIVRFLNIDHLKEFGIYNRWGQQVFSTDNITQGWDGTMNGKPQPLGVYTWYVVAQTKDGQEILRRGNVTLVR